MSLGELAADDGEGAQGLLSLGEVLVEISASLGCPLNKLRSSKGRFSNLLQAAGLLELVTVLAFDGHDLVSELWVNQGRKSHVLLPCEGAQPARQPLESHIVGWVVSHGTCGNHVPNLSRGHALNGEPLVDVLVRRGALLPSKARLGSRVALLGAQAENLKHSGRPRFFMVSPPPTLCPLGDPL